MSHTVVAASTPPAAFGFESDVSARTSGDGFVLSNDVTIMRQFVANLLTPASGSTAATNEFQRADAAPRATLGNGLLDATDIIQARRYAANLDPLTAAGGPTASVVPMTEEGEDLLIAETGDLSANAPDAVGRTIRVVNNTAVSGQAVDVSVELDSQGDEVGIGFTTTYETNRLTFVSATLNPTAAAAGCVLTTNTTVAGRVGVLIDCPTPFAVSPPARQLVTLRFNVAGGLPGGTTTPLTFVNGPILLSTSDANANPLPTAYETGTVTILGPTAAEVSLSGRVTTDTGAGLRNATVIISDENGNRRSVTTGALGYYQFDGIEAGQTYVVSVSAKRFRFASKAVTVNDTATDVNFVGQE